jgi:basic membrane protein A
MQIMHTADKRITLLKLAGLAAAAAALALTGCGKKDEPATATTATPAAPAAAASAPLKVAFAYVGPVGDGGWTFAHDSARLALQKEFGDKIVTSYVEQVPEGADAERVFRDLAGQGNTLIFGTSFGYMEPMLRSAADLKL